MLVHRKFESGQVRGQKDYVIKIMVSLLYVKHILTLNAFCFTFNLIYSSSYVTFPDSVSMHMSEYVYEILKD